MRKLRIIVTVSLLISTILLVTVIADYKFTRNEYELITMIALQCMHVSLFISAVLYAIKHKKENDNISLIVTMVPFIALVASIIFRFFGFIFPSLALLLFDMYIIVWFSILLSDEMRNNKRNFDEEID